MHNAGAARRRKVFVGPVPVGHDVHHRYQCRVRNCIEPTHLEPLPWKEHRLMTAWRKANPPGLLCLATPEGGG